MHIQTPRKVPGHERNRRSPKPLKRRVHITVGTDTLEWTYQIHSGGIRVRPPDGETINVSYSILCHTGRNCDEDERWAITPSLVKEYIKVVLINGGTWDFAKHVGAIYVGGVLVYKAALEAKRENDKYRRAMQMPLLVPLAKADKHQWFNIEGLCALYAAWQGQVSRSNVVDCVVTLFCDSFVEADRPITETGVQFRLKNEHRASIVSPKVAILSEEDERKRGKNLPIGWRNDMFYAVYLRQKFSVPQAGSLISVEDEEVFLKFCKGLDLHPRIVDRY